MRVPLLGPLAASGLLGLSLAQAPKYGDPSNSSPKAGDGLSDGSSDASPTCVQNIATTVFVTVLPTSPADSSDGSEQDSHQPVQTVTETLPATTIFVSAGAPEASEGSGASSAISFVSDGAPRGSDDLNESPLSSSSLPDSFLTNSASGVEPFTTLTIDIWGTGYEDDSKTGATATGLGPSSVATGDTQPSTDPSSSNGDGDSQSNDDTNDSGTFTAGPEDEASNPTAYGSTDISQWSQSSYPTSTTLIDAIPSDPASTWYTVVTDSDIYWTTDSTGPSQVTILLSHTLTLDRSFAPTSDNYGADPTGSRGSTVTGPDGLPTVVVDSASDDSNVENDPVQHPACTKTITGTDGRPTIIITPLNNGSGDGRGIPSDSTSVPHVTDSKWPISSSPAWYSSGDGQPTPSGSGELASGTFTTYTSFGTDGLPTVIESAMPFPRPGPITISSPQPTQSSFPGQPDASGSPSDSTISPGDARDGFGGITTSFTFTYTGPNGPTAVESTVVIFPTPPVSEASDILPTSFPSITEATNGIPGPAQAVTTCFSYTVIGADGLPTVIDSTVVLSPTNGAADSSWPVPTTAPISGASRGLPVPGGVPVTTCFSHTFTGADGQPTVLETTLVVTPTDPASGPSNVSPFPGMTNAPFSGFPTALPSNADVGGNGNGVPVTTCTTFTYIGADGLPTVREYTWTTNAPITSASALPWDITPSFGGPVFPTPGAPEAPVGAGVITCTTYTLIGADGLPTVTEASWIIPGTLATQTAVPPSQILTDASGSLTSGFLPPGFPSQISGIPGFSPGSGSGSENGGNVATTCTSYTVLGADGKPTVVEATWTVPVIGPAATPSSLAFPSAVTSLNSLPSGIVVGGNAITTSFTAFTVGPDGRFTPVVQSVIFTPGAIPTPGSFPFPSGPFAESSAAGVPSLGQYGQGSAATQAGLPAFPPGFTPIITDGRALPVSGVLPPLITGTMTATRTSTVTATSPALPGIPGVSGELPPSYGNSRNGGFDNAGGLGLPSSAQPYDAASAGLPSELTLWPSSNIYTPSTGITPVTTLPCSTTTLRTSTWTNIIPELTTTYTMNYPLTTLVTLTTPAAFPVVKRVFRRQEISESSLLWANSSAPSSAQLTENSSIGASLSSAIGNAISSPAFSPTPSPVTPSATSPSSSRSTVCSTGGNVGNYTLDFDEIPPGPLYNPAGDFWFSEGFSVVPPSVQSGTFAPSSGGQLIEFNPLSILPSGGGSSDTAEIGVGPHFASSCFKFDLYGLSLGCAAQGNEQWCEFEFSAYAYDEATGGAESTSWSETKRVPACPEFPTGGCTLTPIELEGYNNITSVLITLRVGLDLRVWWGDDLRVGWTDNSCEAGFCRSNIIATSAKRERAGLPQHKRVRKSITTGLNTTHKVDYRD